MIVALYVLLALALLFALAFRPSPPRCRQRGGPCAMSLRTGHCLSPNGCGDFGPPPSLPAPIPPPPPRQTREPAE